MEKNAKKVPRFFIQQAKKSAMTSKLCLNSSNITSPHSTINVTETSKNVSRSLKEVSFKRSFHVVHNEKILPVKKQIKMSEELSSKHVILVLPNTSPSTLKPNSNNKNDVKIINNCHTKKYVENSITKAKTCQPTTHLSDNLSDNNDSNCKVKCRLTDSTKETNIDEGFDESLSPADLSINYHNVDKVRKVYVPRYHSTLNKLSNNNSNEKVSLATSSSKQSSTPCQVVRINKVTELETSESKNSSASKKSTIKPINSSALPQQSKNICEKILTGAENLATSLPSSSSSSDKPNSITAKQPTANLPFRQIKINGLTLRAIDPSILNDSKLKERIKPIDRSQLPATTLKPSSFTKDISESAVTTTTVESSHQIHNKNDNCEKCARLDVELNKQQETIGELQRNLVKLTTSKQFYLNIIKQMKDMNTQLTEDLKNERDHNSKLRKGIETRDKHIKELEYELTQVSKIFNEMESKVV